MAKTPQKSPAMRAPKAKQSPTPEVAASADQRAPVRSDAPEAAVEPPAPEPVQDLATSPVEAVVEAARVTDEVEILDPADFGLTVDADGLVSLKMLTGMAGTTLSLSPGDAHRSEPQEACRLARAEFACQGQPQA